MVEVIISLLKLVRSLDNKSLSAPRIQELTFLCMGVACVQSYRENDTELMRKKNITFISLTVSRYYAEQVQLGHFPLLQAFVWPALHSFTYTWSVSICNQGLLALSRW